MTTKQKIKYVRWDELSDEAKQRFLTEGHESNRPKLADQRREANRFAEDGSGWQDHYALAGFFPVKIK